MADNHGSTATLTSPTPTPTASSSKSDTRPNMDDADVDALMEYFDSEFGSGDDVVLTRKELLEKLKTFRKQLPEYRTRGSSRSGGNGGTSGGGAGGGEVDAASDGGDRRRETSSDVAVRRRESPVPPSVTSRARNEGTADEGWMSDGSTKCTCIYHNNNRVHPIKCQTRRRHSPSRSDSPSLPPSPLHQTSSSNHLSSSTTTATTDTPLKHPKVCRICLGDDRQGRMLAPCKCAGSSRYIHRECLDQWRKMSPNPMSKVQCDVCKTFYRFRNWSGLFEGGLTL
ncbi:hypothetical protein HK104_000299, partial [Borealophlyctis nickersoniae]